MTRSTDDRLVLSEGELAVLRLADRGLSGGELTNAIRDLGHSEVGFFRKLNWLLDTERALAAHPVLVNRLRRIRRDRSAVRRPG